MKPKNRQAVVILGMHRGGTSALAGTAVRLGFAPPRRALPIAADNPTGFYESLAVTGLNDALLGAMGGDWIDCLGLDPGCLDGAAQMAALNRCIRIIHDDFGDTAAFVLKDPRLCLTLPVWLPPLRAAGAAVSVLLVVRHPVEVARSLETRDGLAETRSVAAWLHHMLEAERLTRGLPRSVVAYGDLLSDWRGCAARAGRQAGIVWPAILDPWAPVEVDLFLRSTLRHHVAGAGSNPAGPVDLGRMAAEAWMLFLALTDQPEAVAVRRRLDALHRRFAAWRREHAWPRANIAHTGFSRPESARTISPR